jgi:hypothetical protein
MSPAVDVRDFISNTGVHVSSIATNFTGGTNVVRADSIYVLDEGLRLKASPRTHRRVRDGHELQPCVRGRAAGDTSGNPSDRVVFAADLAGTSSSSTRSIMV